MESVETDSTSQSSMNREKFPTKGAKTTNRKKSEEKLCNSQVRAEFRPVRGADNRWIHARKKTEGYYFNSAILTMGSMNPAQIITQLALMGQRWPIGLINSVQSGTDSIIIYPVAHLPFSTTIPCILVVTAFRSYRKTTFSSVSEKNIYTSPRISFSCKEHLSTVEFPDIILILSVHVFRLRVSLSLIPFLITEQSTPSEPSLFRRHTITIWPPLQSCRPNNYRQQDRLIAISPVCDIPLLIAERSISSEFSIFRRQTITIQPPLQGRRLNTCRQQDRLIPVSPVCVSPFLIAERSVPSELSIFCRNTIMIRPPRQCRRPKTYHQQDRLIDHSPVCIIPVPAAVRSIHSELSFFHCHIIMIWTTLQCRRPNTYRHQDRLIAVSPVCTILFLIAERNDSSNLSIFRRDTITIRPPLKCRCPNTCRSNAAAQFKNFGPHGHPSHDLQFTIRPPLQCRRPTTKLQVFPLFVDVQSHQAAG